MRDQIPHGEMKTQTHFPMPPRLGSHPALDFANTRLAPQGDVIDFVAEPAAWLEWLHLMGDELGDALALSEAAQARGELGRVLTQAHQLREWLREQLDDFNRHGYLKAAALAPLNAVFDADKSVLQIEVAHKALVARRQRNYSGAMSALLPIADAIADLLTAHDHRLVHKCANPACMVWFLDTTKRGNRSWCSPAICGNRAKVVAFRSRQRGATD